MQLISSVTVGAGGVTSISFNSIPATFTDLTLIYCGANTAGITFNNDTGSNYNQLFLRGNGASTLTQKTVLGSFGVQIGVQSDASDLVNSTTIIPNYAGSSAKTVSVDAISERNSSTSFQFLNAGGWTGTAAITSIKIEWFASTYPEFTTAYLYGILKGSGGATVS